MIYSAAMGVAIGEYLGLSKEEIIRGVAASHLHRVPDAADPLSRGADHH